MVKVNLNHDQKERVASDQQNCGPSQFNLLFAGGDVCVSGHDSGPVFEEQPSGVIYPEGLSEGKVTLSCQARASPAASYRWVTCMHTHTHGKQRLYRELSHIPQTC